MYMYSAENIYNVIVSDLYLFRAFYFDSKQNS